MLQENKMTIINAVTGGKVWNPYENKGGENQVNVTKKSSFFQTIKDDFIDVLQSVLILGLYFGFPLMLAVAVFFTVFGLVSNPIPPLPTYGTVQDKEQTGESIRAQISQLILEDETQTMVTKWYEIPKETYNQLEVGKFYKWEDITK
jgi:hypothetical protein